MTRYLAAALVALALLATPAGASTQQEKDQFIHKFLTKQLTPEEPWAHTKEIRVSDGFAHEPVPIKDAWVRFVNEKGYVKPLPPPPVPTTSTPASIGATAGVEASTLYASGPYAIPTYIVMCESGGNYLAENAYSTASGAYQIIDGTWAGYGGYSHASHAPPAVQDAKAAELWAGGAGAFHWAACL